MSVLERSQSYRESNKGSKEKQRLTLGVRFTEVSVKSELTVIPFFFLAPSFRAITRAETPTTQAIPFTAFNIPTHLLVS